MSTQSSHSAPDTDVLSADRIDDLASSKTERKVLRLLEDAGEPLSLVEILLECDAKAPNIQQAVVSQTTSDDGDDGGGAIKQVGGFDPVETPVYTLAAYES